MRLTHLAATILAALTGCATAGPGTARTATGASTAEPVFTAADLRSDFAALYAGLQSAHVELYAFTPKDELDALYREALAALDRPMTLAEAQVRFELFAARVRMGHTRVDFPRAAWQRHLDAGGRAFPLDLRIMDGQVHVAVNRSGLETIQAGDVLVALNGEPMARVLERVERHVSAETAYMAHSLMEYDFPRYLWLETGSVERFMVTIARPANPPVTLWVPARTRAELAAASSAQPPTLDLEHPLRDRRILPGNVGYLRPGPFYNVEARTGAEAWDVSGFRGFVDEAFSDFLASGVQRLIVDLRGNPGGDSLFSDVLVAWFADRPFQFFSSFRVRVSPESTAANLARLEQDAVAAGPISRQYARLYAGARPGEVVAFELPLAQPRQGPAFRGRVYVLVDRQTYSNAVAVAATVQDFKFGTLLGEETSDMATTYGAMEQFRLPKTGIAVGYPKAFIVRPNGDLRSRGVVPDVPIRFPIALGAADEVLDRALAFVTADR